MKLPKNMTAAFVLFIIILIIVPLNTIALDMMFLINITVSLIILLTTMYVIEPLEFAVFPSLLLITTLLRLGLNLSSTRLILGDQGKAGQVIQTFGDFVIQNNIVVGFVIFMIIVIVQFVVITKGSERVAEVAARFTLDAIPGKQMAIDADLSAGLITEEEAKARRHKLQKESDFYGAMDGATKLVKGDAIVSIIITFVNFIGGLVVGMLQGGGSFSEVITTYSIATVGDGLVSQFPALLISVATGIMVTRSSLDESLNQVLSKQLFSQPKVLRMAGAVLLLFILVPGSPKLQLIILSSILMGLGYRLNKAEKESQFIEEEPVEESVPESEFYKDVDNIYSALSIEPIELEFGYSLIPLVDEGSGSDFIDRVVMFRKQFATEMGLVIPAVRLRDNTLLTPNQYVIKVRGNQVATGEILCDYYLALDPGNTKGSIDGIETIEPAYGIPGKWISYDKKDLAELYGYTVIDSLSVLVTHLSEVIKNHASELLTRQELNFLLDNIKERNPVVIEEVIPKVITTNDLQKILCKLLNEGVSIRDLEYILEIISSHAGVTNDTDMLCEYVRQGLKRTITKKYSENGQIKVITLDPEIEQTIISSVNKNEFGTYLNLAPDQTEKIITAFLAQVKKAKNIVDIPIVLTSPIVRIYVQKLIDEFYKETVVLSFNEIDQTVQIQAIGTISL